MKSIFALSQKESILCATMSLLLAMPALYCVTMVSDASFIFLLPNLLACLPLAFLVVSIRRYWLFLPILIVLMLATGVECFLIVAYEDFVRCGNLLSTFGTNTRESSNFAANNTGNLMWELPVIFLALAILVMKWRTKVRSRHTLAFGILTGVLLLLLSTVYSTLSYPPYNLFVQGTTAIRQTLEKKYLIPRGDDMTFGATRNDTTSAREIYVFGVGESLRYDHTTFGGYQRNTTPELAANPNVVAFSDYRSTGTLTLYSVPMMITRATTADFNINFTEKSITEPYRECGFKTYVISCKKFLSQQPYLSRGCDGLISVSHDAEIPHVVDSISSLYPKTFFIVQLFQCHSYYSNFTPEYDRFHPNLISDPDIEDKDLYLNAYDNCVLYTDHIISTLLSTIDRPDTRSAFIFASDHGEVLDIHGHRRGNNMTPPPAEYHVPFIFWHNDAWGEAHPAEAALARTHRDAPVNGDALFYTACDMAGIQLPEKYAHPNWSVLNAKFRPHVRQLLLPDGRSVLE